MAFSQQRNTAESQSFPSQLVAELRRNMKTVQQGNEESLTREQWTICRQFLINTDKENIAVDCKCKNELVKLINTILSELEGRPFKLVFVTFNTLIQMSIKLKCAKRALLVLSKFTECTSIQCRDSFFVLLIELMLLGDANSWAVAQLLIALLRYSQDLKAVCYSIIYESYVRRISRAMFLEGSFTLSMFLIEFVSVLSEVQTRRSATPLLEHMWDKTLPRIFIVRFPHLCRAGDKNCLEYLLIIGSYRYNNDCPHKCRKWNILKPAGFMFNGTVHRIRNVSQSYIELSEKAMIVWFCLGMADARNGRLIPLEIEGRHVKVKEVVNENMLFLTTDLQPSSNDYYTAISTEKSYESTMLQLEINYPSDLDSLYLALNLRSQTSYSDDLLYVSQHIICLDEEEEVCSIDNTTDVFPISSSKGDTSLTEVSRVLDPFEGSSIMKQLTSSEEAEAEAESNQKESEELQVDDLALSLKSSFVPDVLEDSQAPTNSMNRSEVQKSLLPPNLLSSSDEINSLECSMGPDTSPIGMKRGCKIQCTSTPKRICIPGTPDTTPNVLKLHCVDSLPREHPANQTSEVPSVNQSEKQIVRKEKAISLARDSEIPTEDSSGQILDQESCKDGPSTDNSECLIQIGETSEHQDTTCVDVSDVSIRTQINRSVQLIGDLLADSFELMHKDLLEKAEKAKKIIDSQVAALLAEQKESLLRMGKTLQSLNNDTISTMRRNKCDTD